MINELLDESTFESALPDRQQALIVAHCKGLVGLIETAQSPGQAATIVDKACVAFEKECASTLVRNALSTYLKAIQRKRWGLTE